jgi:TatA/E family protein of Tat protein translocase
MPGILLFFDISGGELMVILLVAFLVFGPKRIPEIARKIGKGMNEIRRASDEIKREINKEARKLENEVDVENSILKDIKKTKEDVEKDLDGISSPPDHKKGVDPVTKPKKEAPDDLMG